MRKIILTLLNILLIIPFMIFFRIGGNVTIFMLPVWLVMTIVNTKFAQNTAQLIWYNACLAVFAAAGIFICGQLYFQYVYRDGIGEAIVILEMKVEVIYISILTVIESFVRRFINRKNK